MVFISLDLNLMETSRAKNMTFESYLQEEFMKEYHGVKDDYENAYDAWLSNLDVQEVIDMAEAWGKTINTNEHGKESN